MSLDEKLGQMICPGEFFYLDDLLKGLAGVCRPGQNDPAWMPESCWKFCRDVKKDVKMRFYLLEKVSIIQVR